MELIWNQLRISSTRLHRFKVYSGASTLIRSRDLVHRPDVLVFGTYHFNYHSIFPDEKRAALSQFMTNSPEVRAQYPHVRVTGFYRLDCAL